MKLVGNIIALVIWGFFIAFGFWAWNKVAENWADPALAAAIERRKQLKAAKAPAEVQG